MKPQAVFFFVCVVFSAQEAKPTEVRVSGFVNIYHSEKPPVRAMEGQATAVFEFDENVVSAENKEVPTNTKGEFLWVAHTSGNARVPMKVRSNMGQQFRTKEDYKMVHLQEGEVSLKELRLFDVVRLANETFSEQADEIKSLNSAYPCLGVAEGPRAIWSCWNNTDGALKRAMPRVLPTLSTLRTLTPRKAKFVQQELNLMTSAAMFCAQRSLTNQSWVDRDASLIVEQANSLMACAQGLGQNVGQTGSESFRFTDLRSHIRGRMQIKLPLPARQKILQLWLDSYFFEFNETQLNKLAVLINNNYRSEWQQLMKEVAQSVPKFTYFPKGDCSDAQIDEVRRVLPR